MLKRVTEGRWQYDKYVGQQNYFATNIAVVVATMQRDKSFEVNSF